MLQQQRALDAARSELSSTLARMQAADKREGDAREKHRAIEARKEEKRKKIEKKKNELKRNIVGEERTKTPAAS